MSGDDMDCSPSRALQGELYHVVALHTVAMMQNLTEVA